MKQKFWISRKFSLKCLAEATVRKVVKNLPSDKATAGEYLVNELKSSDSCFWKLTKCIKEAFIKKWFPGTYEVTDITPVHKKLGRSGKANHRPISILPLVSKVFISFMNTLKICGFCKAHFTQHALFRLLQRWQSARFGRVGG